MTTITTTGTGETFRRAERANLTARISVSSDDRSDSIAGATALHNTISARARELQDAGAATWHEASALSTYVNSWDQGGGRHTEHITTSVVQVRLSDLVVVAEVVDEFSRVGATVGVDWSLTAQTRQELSRSMRSDAVADARGRADDYAQALGQTVLQVVAVREGEHPQVIPLMRAAMSSMDAGRADVTVPDIAVQVTVTGEFLAE